MKVGAIIFACMSSTRLRGKVLLPVGDRPLLSHVVDRARKIRRVAGVVLATSTDPSDEPLIDFATKEGLEVFRGSRVDVAQRALDCAYANRWTAFARVCGDRPFFDPIATDRAIERMLEGPGAPPDLVSNLLCGGVAPGLTVEIVHTDGLARVLRETGDPHDREHLTRHFYSHSERFRLASAGEMPGGTEDLRFAVDTSRDLERARWVTERLSCPERASVLEVARLLRAWEETVATRSATDHATVRRKPLRA